MPGFDRFTGTEDYITDTELRDAVNVAVAIERPLLIKGEPGTGKTLLAHAISEALNLPLFSWHVKSTTKAQDGLYVYDTVQRLNDARFGEGDTSDINQYIRMGPLGQAFSCDSRAVLLIDEIDKAELEFPNDLLHELDVMAFEITETRELISAKNRPVVIITSNNEKELPDAFLRRCVFHWISFPDHALMKQIVNVHHPGLAEEMVSQCVKRFYWIREQATLRKRPSTSEFIDWIAAIVRAGIDPEQLSKELPFLGVLIKSERDEMLLKQLTQKRHQGANY
jgi:MoxR-like ATPase